MTQVKLLTRASSPPHLQFNPLSWLYKDTPLSGVVGGGGSVAGGGGMSSAFGGGTTGVGALGREAAGTGP